MKPEPTQLPPMFEVGTRVVIKGTIVNRHGMEGSPAGQMYFIRADGDRQSINTNRANVVEATDDEKPIHHVTDLGAFGHQVSQVTERMQALGFHYYNDDKEPELIKTLCGLQRDAGKQIADYIERLQETEREIPEWLQDFVPFVVNPSNDQEGETPKSNRGGFRPGSGRKPSSAKQDKPEE